MVLDKQAGFLRPELAVLLAAAAAERAGASVERYTRIEAIEPDADGVTVRAAGAERRFGRVVVAGGAWSGRLLARIAPWIGAGISMSGMPSVDGAGIKVASNAAYGAVANPDTLNRTVAAADLAPIRDAVTRLLPGLYPDPVRVSAYVEGYTPDGHALVGALPGSDRVIVLAGFSGHGFKMSPVIGDIAADLVLDGKTDRPVDHLAPDRFA
jgi:sarcosine oxidase